MDIPIIDATRFRINSYSSIDQYETGDKKSDEKQQLDIKNQYQHNKKITLDIPLIQKRMNPIEKYVSEFLVHQLQQKKSRKKKIDTPLYDRQLSNSKHIQKISSISDYHRIPDPKQLQQRCYVKYQSTSSHQTQSKAQALQDIQNQYIKLKYSISIANNKPEKSVPYTHYIRQSSTKNTIRQDSPTRSFVNNKSIDILNKRKLKLKYQQGNRINDLPSNQHRINQNDIQKEIKTSLIQDNGRTYFADLYLMKKQRDRMLNQIFSKKDENKAVNYSLHESSKFIPINSLHKSIHQQQNPLVKFQNSKKSMKKLPKLIQRQSTKQINANSSLSYEQRMKVQQQNFVQQKILKERSIKKQKMLKGRNLNWNVYYEMLALKSKQKSKLKQYCKFTQTYGED